MHWAGTKLQHIVFACCLLPLLFRASFGSTVNVNNENDFQLALRDSSVQEIVLEQDLLLTREQWAGFHSRAAPYPLTRNLTITSSPRMRKLDFNYVGDGQVQLAPGVVLNISYTLVENARYGAGVQLDFLAHSPGSYVALWHSMIIRMACVSSQGEPDAVAVQPRLPGFPGRQQASYQDNFCVRKVCYDHVLVYDDFTKVTGTSTEDTAAGGYAIVMRNFTKVCHTFLDEACVGAAWSVDECVRNAIDRLSTSNTPGQITANAAAAQRRITALTAGLAAGLGGGVLVSIAVALLVMQLRRRRLQRLQLENEVKMLSQCCNTPHCSPDPELGMRGTSGGSGPVNNKDVLCVVAGQIKVGHAASSTPPGMHNSWELAACKTSERFLHQQQQLHTNHHHSSADLQHYASLPAAGAGWYVRSNTGGAGSTADLIAGTTGSNTDGKVTLGVLLGAGSFGRVYKGRWRAMDVAVKVLQHSRAAAPNVANEVDLMMSFAHPHVVCAYHFVTWKRRNAKEATGCTGLEVTLDDRMQSVDVTAVWPNDAAAAAADGPMSADLAGPQGELPEDTQTWIVQEFCDAGSLSEYCLAPSGGQRLPEGHAMLKLLFRLREVADGMSYLHRRDVVHGDLKSGNVLLCVSAASPYGRIAKVTDFGLSRALGTGQTHRSTHTLGTVSHMAPELLRFGKMSPAVDVFSFGIMMWELLTARVAFKGLHYGAIIEHVALMGERPPMPEGTPEDFRLLMSSCWHADAQQRPAFDQVMRCLDIMISCRQQELVEAKSGSSAFAAAMHSGSGCAAGPVAPHQHMGTSSGEFALTVTTRAGSSRLSHVQHAPQQQQQQFGSQQSLQLHTSQSLAQTSQSLAQQTTHSNAAVSTQSNAAVTPQSTVTLPQQQQQGEGNSSVRRSRLAPGSGRLGLAVDDALAESPFGPQDL